jgi:hypothetical protein
MSTRDHVIMKGRIPHAMMLVVLVIAQVHMGPWAHAQTTGTLRFFIEPGHDFQFVLDRKYRMQQREVTLGEGPHHFTFWAPKHRMVDTMLTVAPNTVTTFTLRLPVSAEYMAWQREVAKYKRQVVLGRGLPLAATVGFGVWSVVALADHKAAYDQLQDDEALYSSARSPREIEELKKETLPADKNELQRTKEQLALAAGLTAVSAGVTVWMFHKTKGRQVPVFEDKEKVRFDGLVWLPPVHGSSDGVFMASVMVPLR